MRDQEIDQWRQKLLSTREPTLDELDRLRIQERDRYLTLCRALAWDSSASIRLIALRQLGYYGERNDSAAEAAALDAATHIPHECLVQFSHFRQQSENIWVSTDELPHRPSEQAVSHRRPEYQAITRASVP